MLRRFYPSMKRQFSTVNYASRPESALWMQREGGGVRQCLVDAFVTNSRFSGNPAAVTFAQGDDIWMQSVAMECGAPVTAFVTKLEIDHHYDIRWFTPTNELQLCGHASMATTHVLYETGLVPQRHPVTFHNIHAGRFVAIGDQEQGITLSFPTYPMKSCSLSQREIQLLSESLGIKEVDILFSGRASNDLFIEVSEVVFAGIKESIVFSAIEQLGGRCMVVTSSSSSASIDFQSRVFLPLFGINEDSASGSPHCALAPYWSAKLGKKSLIALQASPRGGMLHLQMTKDGVDMTGRCRTTMLSHLLM